MLERQILQQWLTNLLCEDVIDIFPASDGYHNKVFIITRSADRIIARLSSRNGRILEDIQAELAWVDALGKAGVLVAEAITLPGHDQIIELDIDESAFWLTFFKHTGGRPVDVLNLNEWNMEFFREWGSQLARMHNVDTSQINRPIYVDSGKKTAWPMDEWLECRHMQLLSQMAAWKRTPDTFGLIHNDLHQGNFHVIENELIFFDFDDCAYHFYAQDLAVSIYHALWTGTAFHPETQNFSVEFLTAFLKGYSLNRRLNLEIYDQLLVCLQMREVYLYALFTSVWKEEEMVEWQQDKLLELELTIKAEVVPYKEELENLKYLFE